MLLALESKGQTGIHNIGGAGVQHILQHLAGGGRHMRRAGVPTFGFGVTVAPQPHSHEQPSQQSSGQQQGIKMYVYPAAGQSEAQTSEDRYQCHVWATNQSGYDPTMGAGKREDAEGYSRAFSACMAGRNYVVR